MYTRAIRSTRRNADAEALGLNEPIEHEVRLTWRHERLTVFVGTVWVLPSMVYVAGLYNMVTYSKWDAARLPPRIRMLAHRLAPKTIALLLRHILETIPSVRMNTPIVLHASGETWRCKEGKGKGAAKGGEAGGEGAKGEEEGAKGGKGGEAKEGAGGEGANGEGAKGGEEHKKLVQYYHRALGLRKEGRQEEEGGMIKMSGTVGATLRHCEKRRWSSRVYHKVVIA